MTPQPSQECGCKIKNRQTEETQHSRMSPYAIEYCLLHAKAGEMLELLKLMTERMSLINGEAAKCIHNDESICANHALISMVRKLIAEIEGVPLAAHNKMKDGK